MLLELPTGWRNGARVLGRSDVLIMMQQWYQSEHGERRLGGNTSRNPDYKFQYFTEAPLIGDLIGLMNADRDHIAQALLPLYMARSGVFLLEHGDDTAEALEAASEGVCRAFEGVRAEILERWQLPA